MAIEGNKRQQSTSGEGGSKPAYKKKYGFELFDIVGVNLSYDELKENGFYVKQSDEGKERVFTGEKDGLQRVNLEFACKSRSGWHRQFRITIFNEPPKPSKSGFYQFINDQCKTGYSLEPDTFVPTSGDGVWFTGHDNCLNPRPAKSREADFANFMYTCMAVDFNNGGTLKYNLKKFFNGNFKELKDDLKTDFLMPIIVATTIELYKDENGEDVQRESFYPYGFAPAKDYPLLLKKKEWTREEVEKLAKKDEENEAKRKRGEKRDSKDYISPLEKIMINLCRDKSKFTHLFHLGLLKDFNPDGHLETSNKAVIKEEDETPAPSKRASDSDY